MARIKPSKESEEKAITPKPTVNVNKKADTIPTGAPKLTVKKAEQPKRRTLQDRRPALKGIQDPVERKIISKPIYGKDLGIKTKRISETKEVVSKHTAIVKRGTITPKSIQPIRAHPLGMGTTGSGITQARVEQRRAIDEAREAAATRQREDIDLSQGIEPQRREREEAGYKLSIDTQGKYIRKR